MMITSVSEKALYRLSLADAVCSHRSLILKVHYLRLLHCHLMHLRLLLLCLCLVHCNTGIVTDVASSSKPHSSMTDDVTSNGNYNETKTMNSDHSYQKCPANQIREKAVHLDHNYVTTASPRGLKHQLLHTQSLLVKARHRQKLLRQSIRRLNQKVQSLTQVIKDLRNKNLISDAAVNDLSACGEGIPFELFQRVASQKNSAINKKKYHNEIRKFALTLHFYSPRAYKYVRSVLRFALPHPSVIRSWYHAIDGEPGFTKESFDILKLHVNSATQKGSHVICNLVMDEMSIRKHIEYDGTQFRGYVDHGTGNMDTDSLPVATEALVLMVVPLNSSWKLPIGYFLIHSLTSEEKANLVRESIVRLNEINVEVACVTCDGAPNNMTMFTELGASTNVDNLKPYFPHPCDPTKFVNVMLDVCHMLKLLRNTFGTRDMFDGRDRAIKWDFIDRLHKLQENEGLRLGNRLKSQHINWKKNIMKVRLAAQVISSSVADSLKFCESQNYEGFKDCDVTIEFLQQFDRLFDVLNSRNPIAKNYKAPLKVTNINKWMPFLVETRMYIIQLKNADGLSMTKTRRKTAFIGFIMAIDSVIALFNRLVLQPQPRVKYLLTYKLSQDFLELFFGCIRAKGGFNNNPTARQFVASYKRLLVRHEIETTTGNCCELQHIPILSFDNAQYSSKPNEATVTNLVDCHDTPDVTALSQYVENAVSYIAGYVIRNVSKNMTCETCLQALKGELDGETWNQFLAIKTRGGLVVPSISTLAICEIAEQRFRAMQHSTGSDCKRLSKIIQMSVTKHMLTDYNVFPSLQNHMFETEPENNHRVNLVKLVTAEYVKIRMYHLAKQRTAAVQGNAIRRKLSKLILFAHQ